MALSVALGLTSVYVDSAETTRTATFFHQSVGTVVLVLAIFRFGWRLGHAVPPLPASMPGYQRVAAAAAHVALYIMLAALPVTGYIGLAARGRPINIFGLFDLPRVVPLDRQLSVFSQNLHAYLQYPFYGLLLLHVAAALYHHYVVKDDILRRMAPTFPLIDTPR